MADDEPVVLVQRSAADVAVAMSAEIHALKFKLAEKEREIEQRVAAENEACAKLAENPYSDDVRVVAGDEPSEVGAAIAAAIRARK